jgi:putative phosphoserine phosphatase/1-acylglycerol-3-phosphate O-acyltransferase
MTPTIAFFDMDHTVLRDSSGMLYMRYLRRNHQANLLSLLRSYWYAGLYKIGYFNYPVVAAKLLAAYANAGEAETVTFCQRFFDEMMVQYVAEKAVQRLNEHRAQGHLVTMISASTPYMVAPVARHLGIDDFLCTRVEVVDGRFTGKTLLPTCYGADKVYWAEDFARRHGGDLAHAYFYTDSLSDRSLLDKVSHPVAVNPDSRLKSYATTRGWPIEHFY